MEKDDLISRQAAIDAIESTDWYHIEGGELVHGANSKEDEPLYKAKDIYSVIENLPSAQPDVPDINVGNKEPKIIRCRDCKFWNPHDAECEGIGNWFGFEGAWSENGYCYKAERRKGGE